MVMRLARAIGIVCGPPLIPLALALIVTFYGRPARLVDLVAFVVSLALLPALVVYGAFRAGYVSDLGMPLREQRVMVGHVSVVSGMVGVAALLLLGAQNTLVALAAGIAIQLLLLDVLTLRDKVSYHSAGAGGLAVAGLWMGGAQLGMVLVGLALATGWSRWYLGKHTVHQVVVGLATSGTVGIWLYLLSGRIGLTP